jgi:hypothetical protein
MTDSVTHASLDANKSVYALYDLWEKKNAGKTDAPFKARVPSHDVVVLKLTAL